MYIFNEYETALIKKEAISHFEVLESGEKYFGVFAFVNGKAILFTEQSDERNAIEALKSIVEAFQFEISREEW
jgi:REP element-mobilizing transposase RayT